MAFDADHLSKIQLFYEGLTVNGSVYGDATTATTDSFVVSSDSAFITEIEFWVDADDGYLNGLRFTTQNGDVSMLYGADSVDNSTDSDSSMKGDSTCYVMSGYTVYVDEGTGTVSGMDVLMLNDAVGQIASNLPYRVVFGIVFLWWNLFQFIALRYLKRRDGPPLPEGENVFTFSTKSIFASLRDASKYPNMFRFLACWFLYSDSVSTMSLSAVLFAVSELNMTSGETAILLVEVFCDCPVVQKSDVYVIWHVLSCPVGWHVVI